MRLIFLFLLFNLSFLKHISEEGLAEIKSLEGFRDTCYSDLTSVSTIGYGITSNDQKIIGIKIYEGLKITKEIAEEWLLKALKYKYERLVNKYDNYYTFTQNQFESLVSFAYNMGEGNLNVFITEWNKNQRRNIFKIFIIYEVL